MVSLIPISRLIWPTHTCCPSMVNGARHSRRWLRRLILSRAFCSETSCARPKTYNGLTGAVRVFRSEQERAHGPVNAVEIQRLVQPPSSHDERENGFCAAADDYEIERIACPLARIVCRAARQFLQTRSKAGEINCLDRSWRVQVAQIDLLNSIATAAERQHEPKVELLAAADKTSIEEFMPPSRWVRTKPAVV